MITRFFATSFVLSSLACGSVSEPLEEPIDAAIPIAVDAQPVDATPGPINLIRNGDFETDGTLHWTPVDTVLTVEAGGLRLEQDANVGPGLAWQMVDNVGGKRLRLETNFIAGSFFSSLQVRIGTGINDGTFATLFDADGVIEFVSTSPSVWVTLNNVSIEVGQYGLFDDVSLSEVPQ